MRAIGPAGWASHGYFGFGAKTFGNPGGATSGNGYFVPGGVTPARQNAIGNAIAFHDIEGNFLLGGFTAVDSTVFTATRVNVAFLPLASQVDNPLPGADFGGAVYQVYAVPTGFIAIDANNDIGFSTVGVTWNRCTTSGVAANGVQCVAGDEVHHTLCYVDLNTSIWVSPDSGTPNFATQGTGIVAAFPPLAAKGSGSGILLITDGSGDIYQSTDGGLTWVQVGTIQNGWVVEFLGFGVSQWLAIGTDGGGLVQFSVSTDDGATWTVPAALPGANNQDTGFVVAASDRANGWFVGNATAASPDNYWVSNDDGSTWVSPNLLTNRAWFSVAFGRGDYCALVPDPTFSFTYLVTSGDGRTWTKGPNVTEPG